jgi:hypothetical protein
MEISRLTFKGTREEFAAVARLFSGQDLEVKPANEHRNGGASVEENFSAREELVRRVIKRKKIKKGQIGLYKAFANSEDEWLSKPQIAATMEISRQKLAGVLGALGRRINETDGVSNRPGIDLFFEYRQDSEGHTLYRLRPEVRSILKQEGLS